MVKAKFTCLNCGQNAWGKPDLAITCTPCRIVMVSVAARVQALDDDAVVERLQTQLLERHAEAESRTCIDDSLYSMGD